MNIHRPAPSYILTLLFPMFWLSAIAQPGETSRVLVHTLSYISHDYQFAVKDGKVISPAEYEEAKEFGASAVKYYHECAPSWKAEDTAAIRSLVYRLDSLIQQQAGFEIISPIAIEARSKVLASSGLKIAPAQYPDLVNGKTVYAAHCASCHGATGRGDGKEGIGLDPAPRNFYEEERMKVLSPFFAFNTIRLGIPGTGMKAHEVLEDKEVWDVAFYILSLRYEKYKEDAWLNSAAASALMDTTPLEKIATTIDEEFRRSFSAEDADKLLAAIRLHQPKRSHSGFIDIALHSLDEALELYRSGQFKQAAQQAVLAYLEGIEPIEMPLKASDPQLATQLELEMQQVRKTMQQQQPEREVMQAVEAARKSILAAGEILQKREYSFEMAFFMALSILLREGLEAFLVIMVILSILKAGQIPFAKVWVHGGWVAAVLVGVLLWFAGGALLQNQMKHIELIEGIISLVAVGMLLYIGFWLHGKIEMNRWREYVNRMVQGAVKRGSLWGLAGLSFFVVFREVFESVLFLSALNIESGGIQSRAIGLGVLTAFAVVLVLAFFVLKFSARLPIPRLFRISSMVMGILAIVLAGKGIHSFQELGIMPIHGIPVMRWEIAGIYPTLESCAAQALVLMILIVVWNLSSASKKSN